LQVTAVIVARVVAALRGALAGFRRRARPTDWKSRPTACRERGQSIQEIVREKRDVTGTVPTQEDKHDDPQ
jgi:hypothetical protein